MLRRSWVRFLVAVLLIAAAACSGPSPSDASFVGDSITDQARPEIQARFGVPDGRIVAVGGATIDDMAAPAQELAATDPPMVVLNLGTNDVGMLEPPDQIAAELDAVAARFAGARCVFVVTVNEHMLSPQGGDPGTIAADLNRTIRSWDESGNRRVVDWAEVVKAYDASGAPDGPITSDTIHPTDLGRTMLLDEIDAALERC